MEDLILRVAARYTYAMAMADIPAVVQKWESLIQAYRDEAPNIEKVGELYELRNKDYEAWRALGPDTWAFYGRWEGKTVIFPKVSYELLRRLGISNVFLSLLQHYELPPAIHKKVEAAARFYGKNAQRMSRKIDEAVALYRKLLTTYDQHLELAKAALTQGKPRGTEENSTQILNAGPFKVVNTGQFSEQIMQTCADVVRKAASKLQSKGLGQVCYGQVLVSKRVAASTRNLAFYRVTDDELFVRADLKGAAFNEILLTVLHELGHRYYFRFTLKQAEIKKLYYTLKGRKEESEALLVKEVLEDPNRRPQPGEIVVLKRETYVVDDVKYERGGWQVRMHDQTDPKLKAHVGLEHWIRHKGYKLKETPSDFVTSYAKTDPAENFAEMFAYYCDDKLPEEQVEMLKAVL